MTATLLSTWQDAIGAALMRRVMEGAGVPFDFRNPPGEPALAAHDSVAWRVFKNPVALFTGGIAAVILELAEPRVRSGVWERTTFRTDPVARMKRTGMAALVSAYAARSVSEPMIARVRALHNRISGDVAGVPYRASDPELLAWVQITAVFSLLEAYAAYVEPLSQADRNALYTESSFPASLYGVADPARSEADARARFVAMLPKLEPSGIILDFLRIAAHAPILPPLLAPVQHMMIRAGVELVPRHIRERLGIVERWRLRSWERRLVRIAGAASDRVPIPGSPPVEACRRLGLPGGWLYGSRNRIARSI